MVKFPGEAVIAVGTRLLAVPRCATKKHRGSPVSFSTASNGPWAMDRHHCDVKSLTLKWPVDLAAKVLFKSYGGSPFTRLVADDFS